MEFCCLDRQGSEDCFGLGQKEGGSSTTKAKPTNARWWFLWCRTWSVNTSISRYASRQWFYGYFRLACNLSRWNTVPMRAIRDFNLEYIISIQNLFLICITCRVAMQDHIPTLKIQPQRRYPPASRDWYTNSCAYFNYTHRYVHSTLDSNHEV